MSWGALAVALAILGLAALAKDRPRCPYCGAYVSENSRRCQNCGSNLGWA